MKSSETSRDNNNNNNNYYHYYNNESTPRDMGKLEANETNVVENCVYQNQIRDPNGSLERVECQEKFEIKNLILRKWEIVRELPICERPPKSEILNSQFSSVFTKEDRENNP